MASSAFGRLHPSLRSTMGEVLPPPGANAQAFGRKTSDSSLKDDPSSLQRRWGGGKDQSKRLVGQWQALGPFGLTSSPHHPLWRAGVALRASQWGEGLETFSLLPRSLVPMGIKVRAQETREKTPGEPTRSPLSPLLKTSSF